MNAEIRNITNDNVDDALAVCTPEDMIADPFYRKGLRVRKEWLLNRLGMVGQCCKLAYVNEDPVGMIQYNALHHIPYFTTRRKDLLYIHCIFVKRLFRNHGIGSDLLEVLTDEMKKPNPLFEDQPCRAFVTSSRERHAFKQPSYFRLKNFSGIRGNLDAGLVKWLFEEETAESLGISGREPVQMKEQGAVIFYDPSCQYCIYFNDRIKKLLTELQPSIATEEFNLWSQSQEALERKVTSRVTYINGTPVLFREPGQFREDVRKAVKHRVSTDSAF